jgi:hypothetical protein
MKELKNNLNSSLWNSLNNSLKDEEDWELFLRFAAADEE